MGGGGERSKTAEGGSGDRQEAGGGGRRDKTFLSYLTGQVVHSDVELLKIGEVGQLFGYVAYA